MQPRIETLCLLVAMPVEILQLLQIALRTADTCGGRTDHKYHSLFLQTLDQIQRTVVCMTALRQCFYEVGIFSIPDFCHPDDRIGLFFFIIAFSSGQNNNIVIEAIGNRLTHRN